MTDTALPFGLLLPVFSVRAPVHAIVRVDVDDSCLCVDRRATPLRTSIEAAKHYRVFAHAEGNE